MEHTAKGFAAVVQLLSEPPPRAAAWQQRPPVHQPVRNRTAEVVCPLPVRPVRGPCLVDNANGVVYCARPHKGFTKDTFQRQQHQQQAEMELLDFLLGQDGDFDTNGEEGSGFFFGTPPARTGNPIVNDAEFRKQSIAAGGGGGGSSTSSTVSSLPYYPSATPSPRGERGRSSNGSFGSSSPFSTVPNTRVEGFPSSGSDPHPRRRVVSALA